MTVYRYKYAHTTAEANLLGGEGWHIIHIDGPDSSMELAVDPRTNHPTLRADADPELVEHVRQLNAERQRQHIRLTTPHEPI